MEGSLPRGALETRVVATAMVSLFGIRHHGPGSARSLRAALASLAPDVVLIEGPPDADDVIALAAHVEMSPPVALLVHASEETRRAVYYPFAMFSPEWIAILYALERGIPVRFMDLPVSHVLAMEAAREAELESQSDDDAGAEMVTEESAGEPNLVVGGGPPAATRRDPFQLVAEAAGYADGERWWEHLVEERRDHTGAFDAVLEIMSAIREDAPTDPTDPDTLLELRREAWMRQTIRNAEREGFERIAVVCGAWHAPALATRPTAKADAALLKGLPRMKVLAGWIPWTTARLARESGYGAGIESPGWYAHLWEHGATQDASVAWMARVARVLRDEGIDASSAQVIDAVRLASVLAALRGRAVAGLGELNEATHAALLHGNGVPLALVRQRLIVGDALGAVPADAPAVPLQQSLAREQKRLRLKVEASQRALELDLRNATDLERSTLLHRLALLDIPWGASERGTGKGTFKEVWRLEWRPEFALSVIEASVWGTTIADAATARATHLASTVNTLPELAALFGRLLLADVPSAARYAIVQIDALAAVAGDFSELCAAMPPIARTLRYGDVRGTDQLLLGHAVAALCARIDAGLPAACASLDDDAADAMFAHIVAIHDSLLRLQDAELSAGWRSALERVLALHGVHGVVTGRCCRLLLDSGTLAPLDVERHWSTALSPGTDPTAAAAFVDGFLRASGTLLAHDVTLWSLLDGWLTTLRPDAFMSVVPLLRRTIATFSAPERRLLGERAAGAGSTSIAARTTKARHAFDAERAAPVVATVAVLLGLSAGEPLEHAGVNADA